MQELKTALQTEIETLKAALQQAGHEISKNSSDTVQANEVFADQADGMGVAITKLEDNLTAVNGKTQEVDKEIWRLKTNFAEQQAHLDSYKRQVDSYKRQVEESGAREDAASSQAKYELQLVQAEVCALTRSTPPPLLCQSVSQSASVHPLFLSLPLSLSPLK